MMMKMVLVWLTYRQSHSMKTKRPIINKLKYAIRHDKMWRTKVIINKKKEGKKRGVDDEHIT